jgi:drug/metabolite transporter (DMT)-like permease
MAGWYRFTILGFMISMPLLGAADLLISKLFGMEKVAGEEFSHPYFQTFCMFLAECMGYLAYLILFRHRHIQEIHRPDFIAKTKNIPPPSKLIKTLGKFVFGLPALLDILSSTCLYIGVYLTAPSVFQMLSGCLVIFTAFFSMIFLKKKLFRHQIVGIFIIGLGICIVGFVSIFWQASIADDPKLGMAFLVVAHLIAGCQFIIEEKLLCYVIIHPMEVVGIEGLVGSLVYILLLIMFQYVPCEIPEICTNGRVEDTMQATRSLMRDGAYMGLWVGNLVFIMLFNWTGVSVTKYASSLARATMDICRTVLMWVVSICIGWEEFIWIELVGVILLLSGIAIYNEIVSLPCCFYRQNSPSIKIYGRLLETSERKSMEGIIKVPSDSKINETMVSSEVI